MTREEAVRVAAEVVRERWESMSPREVGSDEYRRLEAAVRALEEES